MREDLKALGRVDKVHGNICLYVVMDFEEDVTKSVDIRLVFCLLQSLYPQQKLPNRADSSDNCSYLFTKL